MSRSRITPDEFVRRAKEKHKDKYSYAKTNYVLSNSKVIITCPAHGDFEQTPSNHLAGSGCPVCNKGRPCLTTGEFIVKAKAKHGDKYDYSKVVYVNSHTKVTITCPVHGDFEQIPLRHLHGNGCQLCHESKHEKRLAAVFTKYDVPFKREYKLREYSNLFRYDFYLPLQKVLVEFHGDLHYIPKKFNGGEDELKNVQQRDREKEAIASKAGIPIVVLNTITAKLEDPEYELFVLNCIRTAYQTRRNVYPGGLLL